MNCRRDNEGGGRREEGGGRREEGGGRREEEGGRREEGAEGEGANVFVPSCLLSTLPPLDVPYIPQSPPEMIPRYRPLHDTIHSRDHPVKHLSDISALRLLGNEKAIGNSSRLILASSNFF
jgi:hypothetical protein